MLPLYLAVVLMAKGEWKYLLSDSNRKYVYICHSGRTEQEQYDHWYDNQDVNSA